MAWKLDARSEKILATVAPELQMVARKAVELSTLRFVIASGRRTQSEQDALYAKGRTKPGPRVTWTRKSNHMSGNAIDYAVINEKTGKPDWVNEKPYFPVAKSFKSAAILLGVPIQWGFDMWKKDYGHVQLDKSKKWPPGTITEIQELLRSLGYSVKVDGKYGATSVAAVKAFQKKHPLLKVDGIVGIRTWTAMKDDMKSTEAPTAPKTSKAVP